MGLKAIHTPIMFYILLLPSFRHALSAPNRLPSIRRNLTPQSKQRKKGTGNGAEAAKSISGLF